MKRVGALFLVAKMIVLGLAPPAQAGPVVTTTIWSDGFEEQPEFGLWDYVGGMPGNWDVIQSTLSASTGTRGAVVKGPSGENGDELISFISTLGQFEVGIQYEGKERQPLEVGDIVTSFWTPDRGTTWIPLHIHTGEDSTEWTSWVFSDLPDEADNNPNFGLKFVGDLEHTNDVFNIDNVRVFAAVPEPTSLAILGLGAIAAIRRRRHH